MSRRRLLGLSVVTGLVSAALIGIEVGSALGTGLFALLDLGSGPNSPISPYPIAFSGPANSSTPPRPQPRPRPRPQADDIPFWFPDYRDLWTIRTMDRMTKWSAEADGQWSQLGRTLVVVLPIAALGLYSYLESTIRGVGTPG